MHAEAAAHQTASVFAETTSIPPAYTAIERKTGSIRYPKHSYSWRHIAINAWMRSLYISGGTASDMESIIWR